VKLLATLALLALAPMIGGAGEPATSAVALAERALQSRLESVYPRVSQWDIVPLHEATASPSALLEGHHEADELTVTVTRIGSRSAVWVAARAGRNLPAGGLLWFSVAGSGPAVVATHSLSRGATLDAGDGTLASSDLVAAGCVGLDSSAVLAGMRTKVTIGEGEVICPVAIEPLPPVVRGEAVTVRYAAGPVTLTSRAVAQSDALLGKPVLVRTGSGDLFQAMVSGHAEVRVDD